MTRLLFTAFIVFMLCGSVSAQKTRPGGSTGGGTGTTNTLPKFTTGASGIIGDSRLSDDGMTVDIAAGISVANDGGNRAVITVSATDGTVGVTTIGGDKSISLNATGASVNLDGGAETIDLGTASGQLTVNALHAEIPLSSVAAVNMNTATATTLYTCPAGKTCVITKVTVRNPSTSLTTASYSFGWTSAAFNDVIANATHTELTGSTLYTVLPAKAGAKVGTAAEVLKVLMNTLQGGAATTTIDVFGYVF